MTYTYKIYKINIIVNTYEHDVINPSFFMLIAIVTSTSIIKTVN